ncbi:MAG: N-6 DNA methylase [Candidatus Dadabacteria bacterium]|nr:N-6 DNA methylase [Candidatus Dadabacteria bacterium]
MSVEYIEEYQRDIKKLREVGGSENETVLRSAFQACLSKYCSQQKLILVTELPYKSDAIPDGTVKDSLRLTLGYWEAKDTKDNLDDEISKKIAKGYPTSNIIFENSEIAVLIQDGLETQRVKMSDAKALDGIVRSFLAYEPKQIGDFRKAANQFKDDFPGVLDALREMIDESHGKKPAFREAAGEFLKLCQEAINPSVEAADVREMLIQHILTKDIFLKVFGEDQFHKENNIAARLDDLEETFFTGDTRRAMVDRLKGYYSAITVTAASIESHREKQKFLKAVYEDFYRIYNPKAADRLGVVYTPNEVVEFMIKSADHLVKKHFSRRLYDRNVQILDPAAGTGTFITDLIEFMPEKHVPYKYENEIHANEVGILPYYIANLNIEYTYKQKTGKYREFPNICFVDTLDNLMFKGGPSGRQVKLLGSVSDENLERVKRQNKKRISVIIGNPPYNANQRNENENNKNREYPGIDKRIKETYIKQSTAQKTKQYDMYKRFIRWASDRLDDNGVLALVSNSAFINSGQDDGFRKVAAEEFNEIWIVDLKGNARTSGEQRRKEGGNVFEDKIRVGVAIYFFVKKEGVEGCDIFYNSVKDYAKYNDKIAHIQKVSLSQDDFEHIVPDSQHNWINQTDNDFDDLVCVANKDTKLAKREVDENAVFKLFSLGVVTARDEWVYGFDVSGLKKKVRYFCKLYNDEIVRFLKETPKKEKMGDWVNREIKWTSELEGHLFKGTPINYSDKSIVDSLYRPFVKSNLYYQPLIIHRRYQMPDIFPSGKKGENKVICFSGTSSVKPFQSLVVKEVFSFDFLEKTQCLPLYSYDKDGNRCSNITDWGLKQFRDHYGNDKITAEDIFHYTYAVLHNPAYLEKYAINLKREFPRLPFYGDFPKWVKRGKELMKLHINFEKQKPYKLERVDKECEPGKAKLKADKEGNVIVIDEQTELTGIPPEAWEYRLGNRSALEWVLDQYKEKKPKDPTIREKFNTYKFADHKEEVIKLLGKVCAVSVKTVEIVGNME